VPQTVTLQLSVETLVCHILPLVRFFVRNTEDRAAESVLHCSLLVMQDFLLVLAMLAIFYVFSNVIQFQAFFWVFRACQVLHNFQSFVQFHQVFAWFRLPKNHQHMFLMAAISGISSLISDTLF
jgi:hypothetical protein